MLEYKTIKQIIDTPETHDFIADADSALNAFVAEGWTVENITYRSWNDGPDFFTDRYVTLKRESEQPATTLPAKAVHVMHLQTQYRLPDEVEKAYKQYESVRDSDTSTPDEIDAAVKEVLFRVNVNIIPF